MICKEMWAKDYLQYREALREETLHSAPCGFYLCRFGCKYVYCQLLHYMQPAFVGPITAKEVVEMVYNNSNCTLVAASPERIRDVISRDVLNVGYNPIATLRSFEVNCQLDDYRTPPTVHSQGRTCEHTPAEKMYVDQTVLRAAFKNLLAIPKKGFRLNVVFLQRNVRMAVLVEGMDCLQLVYGEFVNAGGKVSVNWRYNGDHDRRNGGIEIKSMYKYTRIERTRRMRVLLENVSNEVEDNPTTLIQAATKQTHP
jgi:hypothetical protein